MSYGKDYFENGHLSGESLYTDYRWLPELTIPMAYEIIKYLGICEGDKVLDFGCAKGYLVKALRLMHIDAYGYDVSSYAVSKADEDVRGYIHKNMPINVEYDFIIAKDVLEHLSEDELDNTLESFSLMSDNIFVIVPLGDGMKYEIPDYECDITHKIRQPLTWWDVKIRKYYMRCSSNYRCLNLKKQWVDNYHFGNGFIHARTVR